VRNDSGIYQGWEVSPYYDPILSKLVTWGEDRETARLRMRRALDEYIVHGVKTSIDLHKRIVDHPEFVAGDVDTDFIARHAGDLLHVACDTVPDEAFVAAALLRHTGGVGSTRSIGPAMSDGVEAVWEQIGAWRIGEGRGRE
jgi:3-methylcrotonyl-CoA carboxylase alpha subunit